ncbi:MAG: DNA primase, partial [Anaerolineaceae bacterium]|nr:DNA primase [Anaerolineaceae bacterium]
MTAVDEIKSRLDIVDIVSETVKLRHSGKNYTGFCPFHANTKTPAFVVFPDSQTWRCFGQCNEGGDLFNFVMKREGWDFQETLRHLADRAGVTLHEYTPEQQEQVEENEHLREVLSMAATFFQHQLRNTPAGKEALAYLYGRKLTDETIDAFALGYAPDSWDTLTQYMASRNISEQDLLDAGLVSQRDSGGVYDKFRHRLVIPIRDERGKMAGFGGRVLRNEDIPKYLNSPKTALFDKGRLLYGLDMARREIRAKDQVVIVEGYLDVIGPYQAGFKNCVSPMGTALTEDQFRLIKRYSRRIVLALDPDAAGEKATLRGLQTAREVMEREGDMVFDARGLMQVEGRLKADIRVTTLPDGLDPDEIALDRPELWDQLVSEAKPVVVHVMETLAAHADINDPKTKEQIANQVLPLIEDVKGSVEREAYRQQLARLLKVDERALVRQASGGTVHPRRRTYHQMPQVSSVTSPLTNTHRQLEENCIKGLVSDPTLVHFVDRTLRGMELVCLNAEDFTQTDFRELFKIVIEALGQDDEDPAEFVRTRIPDEMQETFLIEADQNPYPDWRLQANAPILESLLNDFVRLRRIRVDEGLEQITFLQSQMGNEEEETPPQDFGKLALEFIQARAKLDRALQLNRSQGKQ